MTYNQIKAVLPQFEFRGCYESVEEITSGNIHTTYHVTFRDESDGAPHEYLLQRFNQYVFRDPDAVARNIQRVTAHLKRRLEEEGIDPARRVQCAIPTRDGKLLFYDREGQCWRASAFITGATAHDSVKKPEHFYEVGRAFGDFQYLLCDFDATQLYEPLPDFHNTAKRYEVFERAVLNDKAGRARLVDREIAFFRRRRDLMGSVVGKLQSGELPVRVTHNDTKINNVLIDDQTDKAVCVIDLDTVMPGSSLYDFGDAVRFGASTGAEDEKDLSRISLDMDLYGRFAKGYLHGVRGFLTPQEIRLMPLGVQIITCELAMRFLTDYLDGDLYFKTHYPHHNLVRTRAQMRLLEDVEEKFDRMTAIMEDI